MDASHGYLGSVICFTSFFIPNVLFSLFSCILFFSLLDYDLMNRFTLQFELGEIFNDVI